MIDDNIMRVAGALILTRTLQKHSHPHEEAMRWAEEYSQAMKDCGKVERMHFWKSVRDRIEIIHEQSDK